MSGKNPKRQRDASRGEVEIEKPPKRRRQDDTLKLSRLYEDLAAESDDIRLEAAKQIIVKFSPENEPSAQALETALNRLVKGLCSSRKAARVGFCITLTELLGQIFGSKENVPAGFDDDVNSIIDLVVEKTKVEGNVPGQERRNHLIGKLFGYKAILQSGILVGPRLSLECWCKVLDHVFGMARDIPWLREECGLILVDAIKSLASRPKSRQCVEPLIQRLISFHLANTPEGVAIWLTVRAHFQDVLPKGIWSDEDPLSKKDRTRLAKVLREDFRNSSENGESENIKTAAANPNPIFVWNMVFSEILQRDENNKNGKKESVKAELPQFWLDVVDNNLFSSTSSHERKSWGFKLFATLIMTVPDWALLSLFSQNFMRTLINQSKKDVRFLHAAALAALESIQKRVQLNPASAVPIFTALTEKNGTIELDRLTKTKTLENIMVSADDDSLKKLIRHLHSLILRPESQEQATADLRRQTIADLLLSIVRNYKRYESDDFTAGEEHDNWLRNTFDILIEHAYFIPSQNAKTSKVPLPALGESTRNIYQERLSSCLTRLLRVETKSRTSFSLMAVSMIRSKASKSKHLEPVFKADKPVLKTINKAFDTIDTIVAKSAMSNDSMAAEGFVLLYCLALLQVYNGDGDAVLLLDDLDASRKLLLKSKSDSSSQGQDAFVEILLSFLGNPRTLFRQIAQEAFTIFASDLTLEGLQSLTAILDTPENAEGQKELFEQGADEEEVESDDDVEDVEDASDVEMINGEIVNGNRSDNNRSDTQSESDSDDEEESSSEAESDDEDDEELARFDDLLAHTLQTSKPSLSNDDAEESSDEDMDDEQMMALDPHLTKIFQERSKQSSKKKERQDAKQTVVQFKSRVLDLLAVFMEKQYSNALTLEVLLPVLRRARGGGNKQLIDKSYQLLKTYTDARAHHKAPLPVPDDLNNVWEILKGIHVEAGMGGGAGLHATACSNASLHIVKILVGIDKGNYSKVVDVYSETQKQWFLEKKSKIQPTLFTQFQNWSVSARQKAGM